MEINNIKKPKRGQKCGKKGCFLIFNRLFRGQVYANIFEERQIQRILSRTLAGRSAVRGDVGVQKCQSRDALSGASLLIYSMKRPFE
jgi:hypothetical protein